MERIERIMAFLVDRPMPTACDECPCMYDYIQCTALKDNAKESLSAVDDYTVRQTWCPIKEIVLCKDCIHQDGKDGQCPVQNTGDPFYDSKPDDDWFCADGKRKGEVQE